MARAFAESLVKNKTEVDKEESTVMARANTAPNAIKRVKQMEYQREELINVVPQVYPHSYTLNTMSTEEMIRASVARITNPTSTSSGCAALGTLDDPRMGPSTPGVRCATCSRTMDHCTGHFGFLQFPVPILTPYPEGVRTIVKVLNLVCSSCGKLKASRQELEAKGLLSVNGLQRLKRLEKYMKGRTCRRSETDQLPPNVVDCSNRVFLTKTKGDKDGIDDIFYQTSKSEYTVLVSPREIYDILDSISDEDAELMGFAPGSHPRNEIWRGMLVLPPSARPANLSEKRQMEHSLTKMYHNILKEIDHINKLLEKQHTDTIDFNTAVGRLRLYVKYLIGITEPTGGHKQAGHSIKSLISSKNGFISRYLMSKRVEGSGRAVMSLDPRLRLGQVGIPRSIARALPVKVTVTPDNLESFNEMLKNGEILRVHKRVPGRSALVSLDMDKEAIKRIVLAPGDVVERMRRNGDFVMINRNPTLSRQSMIGLEVVVTDDRLTIDTHLSYMSGLAGDYDGDEVNVHGPSTEAAQEELREIMNVKKQLISWQTNRPNLYLVFDTITACSLMTQPDTFLEHDDFQYLLSLVQPAVDLESYYRRLRKYFVPIDSGRSLFSAFLPEGLYYQIVEPYLNIQDGILIDGSIKTFHIGSGAHTITQAIFKDIGRDEAIAWLDNAYRVGSAFLDMRGFTIGPADFFPDDPVGVKEQIESEYQKAIMNIERMSKPKSEVEAEKQEKAITMSLDRVTTVGERVLKSAIFDKENNLRILFGAGYPKVTGLTVARVQALIGQPVTMELKRPKAKLSGGRRCLPMFDLDDNDPRAHGFCTKGYAEGLEVSDMMFNAMTDREAITVKYVQSSESGAQAKKLSKGLEDVMVWKDGSVVASGGWIIQPLYGYDGFDVSYLETVRTKMGVFPFFTNVERLCGMINNSRGFYKVGNTWEKTRR